MSTCPAGPRSGLGWWSGCGRFVRGRGRLVGWVAAIALDLERHPPAVAAPPRPAPHDDADDDDGDGGDDEQIAHTPLEHEQGDGDEGEAGRDE